MNCAECGRPLHPMHAECDFCGATSPLGHPNSLEQAVERTRAAATGVLTQARGLRLALPRLPRWPARPRLPHAPRIERPSGRALAVLGGGAALIALFLVLAMSIPRGPAQAEVDAAQAAATASNMKQAELQAALDAAQQRLNDLEAAQGRTQAEGEARATAGETEMKGLREQVAQAEASAKASKDAADLAGRRVQALTECLNGTNVALQFGRTNAWDPADRALAAVSAACADAKALR